MAASGARAAPSRWPRPPWRASAATVGAGGAVAATAHRDSHAYEYHPTRVLAAAIERVVPSGTTIDYHTLGTLPLGTQPIEPALRFFLVRHGDRVLARGLLPAARGLLRALPPPVPLGGAARQRRPACRGG